MGPIYRARAAFRQPHGTNPVVLLAGGPQVFNLLLPVGSDPYSPDFSQDFGVSGSPNVATLTTSFNSGSSLTFNQFVGTASSSAASVQKRTCF